MIKLLYIILLFCLLIICLFIIILINKNNNKSIYNKLSYYDNFSEINKNIYKLSELIKDINIIEIKINIKEKDFFICNPSIVQYNNNYVINLRKTNFCEKTLKNNNKIITDNHLIKINKLSDLSNVMDDIKITLNDNIVNILPCMYYGFEDMRLIVHNNILYGIATSYMTDSTNKGEMVLCRINNNYEIDKVLRLKGYNDHLLQKNWAPFIFKGDICLLYSNNPTIILKPDMTTGNCSIIKSINQTCKCSSFRGGSQLLNYNNGYLYIIHERIIKQTIPYYYHRFIYMDENFLIKKFSPLFFIINEPIEFVSGMSFDFYNKNLLVTFGYNDIKAYIFKVSIESVEKILDN